MSSSLAPGNASSYELEEASFTRAEVAAAFVGWFYFFIWFGCSLPQLFLNHKRKSVAGMNMDFVAYSITGVYMYLVFNLAMYYHPLIRRLYAERHYSLVGKTQVPVYTNDVAFAVAMAGSVSLLLYQCIIYERRGAVISWCGISVVFLSWTIMLCLLPVVWSDALNELDYIYTFSYIKVFLSLLMYVPQVYLNYYNMKADGFSITFALLDMLGGSLSITQMTILAVDHSNPSEIFGNPGKFYTGVISMCFDFILIVQAVCFYPEPYATEYRKVEFRRRQLMSYRYAKMQYIEMIRELEALLAEKRQELDQVTEELKHIQATINHLREPKK